MAICRTVACGPAGLSCSPTGCPHAAHAVSHSVISAGSGMRDVASGISRPMSWLKPYSFAEGNKRFRADLHAQLAEHGVRRHIGRARKRDLAEVVVSVVRDRRVADVHFCRGVIDGIFVRNVVFECCRKRKRLERGAGGVERLRRAVQKRAGVRSVRDFLQQRLHVCCVVRRRRGHAEPRRPCGGRGPRTRPCTRPRRPAPPAAPSN